MKSLIRSKFTRWILQASLAVIIAGLLIVAPGAASAIHAEDDIIHVVQSGESLYSIANQYGVNMYTLARYNGIANVNVVRVGQALRIPTTSVSPAAPVATSAVQPRPRTDYLSPAYKAPVATPTPYIVDGDRPTPTPTPVVPTPIARASTTRVHIVAAFDTLTSIANLYGTSVWEIKARNGLTSDRIYRGQQLIIP